MMTTMVGDGRLFQHSQQQIHLKNIFETIENHIKATIWLTKTTQQTKI